MYVGHLPSTELLGTLILYLSRLPFTADPNAIPDSMDTLDPSGPKVVDVGPHWPNATVLIGSMWNLYVGST